jgi:tetratricopeptide (TPR) repeat protein
MGQISQKPSIDSGRYHHLELQIFRLSMWAVVVCSFTAIATKAFLAKPSSVPFHYFLILVLVGAFFATFAPTLGEYASSRLQKVKFGGFEVELSDAAGKASLRLQIPDVPAWDNMIVDQVGSRLPSDNPFPSMRLTGSGIYEYERLSLRLYLLFDQVKDPNQLDWEARENFRKLILHVGKAAHAMEHYTKALEVLLWLKRFSDRDPDHEESRMLGTAFLWAADEQTDKTRQRLYRNEAIPLLKSALGKHPYQTVTFYNLGWALLSLEKYNNGITHMRKCMKLEPRYAPWAKWNIACGLKKLNRQDDALRTLEEIPPGPWWDGIANDDWFNDPQQPSFMDSFNTLTQTKLNIH